MIIVVDGEWNASVVFPLDGHGPDGKFLTAKVHVVKETEDAPFWRAINDPRVQQALNVRENDINKKWSLLSEITRCQIEYCPCGVFRPNG